MYLSFLQHNSADFFKGNKNLLKVSQINSHFQQINFMLHIFCLTVIELFFMILRIGDEYFVFILSSAPLKKYTSWKSLAISQTRHCCASTEVIWQLCLSARKKSRSTGVCINDCTIQFIKQVFPKLIKPLKPEKNRNQTGTYFQCNLLSKTMLKRPDIEMKSKLNSFYFHLNWSYNKHI